MFRTKRTQWTALALLLAALLTPLPAAAGTFGETSSALTWDGLWADLLAWFGWEPQADSSSIDPNGKPTATPPTRGTGEDSPFIDPNGKPTAAPPSWETANSSSYIDPFGGPTSSSSNDPDGKP
jgi:hypothetical protein